MLFGEAFLRLYIDIRIGEALEALFEFEWSDIAEFMFELTSQFPLLLATSLTGLLELCEPTCDCIFLK